MITGQLCFGPTVPHNHCWRETRTTGYPPYSRGQPKGYLPFPGPWLWRQYKEKIGQIMATVPYWNTQHPRFSYDRTRRRLADVAVALHKALQGRASSKGS